MAQHYLLYGHGGAYNHGGEALACTTIALLRRISPGCRITLSTHFPEQDREFAVDADEFVERNLLGKTNEEVYETTIGCIGPDTVCIHLGGDNYCYPNWQRYAAIHYKARERGAISILWGCSIDPMAIDEEMQAALSSHHLIAAREPITYDALVGRGLSNVTKVSDIAFCMEPQPAPIPLENYGAINLSPLVCRKNPSVLDAMRHLIDFILQETDLNLVLLPHVLASADNDYEALEKLAAGQSSRVVLASDKLSARQYKYIISKARFGVFARTHGAIAAYSTLVPTLAIGYSVKSFGIARDLSMEDYVLDLDCIQEQSDLTDVFCKLMRNESTVKKTLAERMPAYIQATINDELLTFIR